ncbi:MAG: hypothetical protein M1818_004810 [Claussenomyces sp. TS43310]|nr:MAG: hypothetical protein M1818_004810 [Claussenomyces sp. TS43310]
MDRHASSPPGTPAPYGHACANCAQSKNKCIIRQAGGPCERCHRLNKECHPAKTVRRRNPRKPVVSKAARLEEKLDGLVTLIKAGGQSGVVNTSSQATAVVDDSTPQVLTAATTNPTSLSYHHSPFGSGDIGEPSVVEAEEYLINFQTYKSKFFPFIYIPSSISAQYLRQERPFLWLCIMTVGSKSTSQQQVLGSKVRQTVAQEVVAQSEKNIDLLLGLLTFIGWANFQIQGKPFLAAFTQIAMSLVFDLGLNKSVPKNGLVIPCVTQKYSKPPTPRTMEERRAVLGCFLITSIISSSLQKIDALRWTPHMDECLLMLDERKESATDEILVHQVRLQRIVESMALSTSHGGAMESTGHRQPTSLHLENLHSQLQGIKTNLLARTPNNAEVVFLHLYNAELEIALSPTFLYTDQITLQQQKYLKAGLESIKSWFDVFFTIPPAAYIGFPFSIFSQLLRCMMTLYRLMTLDGPTCDDEGVWKTVDPLLVLGRVINNMEQVAILAGLDKSESPGGDVFSRGAQMFRSLRPGWEAKLGRDDLVLSTILPLQDVNETFLPDALGVELFDNDWLTDLLFSPNY